MKNNFYVFYFYIYDGKWLIDFKAFVDSRWANDWTVHQIQKGYYRGYINYYVPEELISYSGEEADFIYEKFHNSFGEVDLQEIIESFLD